MNRQFKENLVMGGCFTVSLIFTMLVLAAFELWYVMPVFAIVWLFLLSQSFREGIWRRRQIAKRRRTKSFPDKEEKEQPPKTE